MSNRPWIWIIVAHVALIAVLTTVVVIARRYGSPEIVLQHGS